MSMFNHINLEEIKKEKIKIYKFLLDREILIAFIFVPVFILKD